MRPPSLYIPGNHDLGLGPSTSIPVDARARQRFISSFGTRVKSGVGVFSDIPLGKWRRATHRDLSLGKVMARTKKEEDRFEVVKDEGLRKINVRIPIWASGRSAHQEPLRADGTKVAPVPPTHELILLDALALARMHGPSETSGRVEEVEGAQEVSAFLSKLAKTKDREWRVCVSEAKRRCLRLEGVRAFMYDTA